MAPIRNLKGRHTKLDFDFCDEERVLVLRPMNIGTAQLLVGVVVIVSSRKVVIVSIIKINETHSSR